MGREIVLLRLMRHVDWSGGQRVRLHLPAQGRASYT